MNEKGWIGMTYKIIPQSDLKVSSICLGGGRIGSAIDEPSSFKLMDYFYGEGAILLIPRMSTPIGCRLKKASVRRPSESG